jgi:hypothetical protein
MLGTGARDARRTEIYLDGLMAAEERGAFDAPVDLDVDPAVLFAARRLRADLVRPHPSFRFEEGLARRLALGAGPSAALRPLGEPGWDGLAEPEQGVFAPGLPRIPSLSSKSARPLIVGGVASAISIGAVYVAWRWSRGSGSHRTGETGSETGHGHPSGRGRRVLNGIFGVMS